jgi:NAD(P)-dependent dehydrogenase (short-subunit alcohol dehydrogenase family)
VCLSFKESEAAAADVVRSCAAVGVAAAAVRADVAEPDDVAELFAAADALGRLGALVNNAGVVEPAARVDEMAPARLARMFSINVIGAFVAAGEAVRRMSTLHGGAGGVIVNVSSAAARLGSPGEYVDYAASKGAIDTMTVGLAQEVAREGIRVNAVRPGLIQTELHARGGQPGRVERLRDGIPMGRGGEPHEVAAAIAWLCSDDASYVTGAILDVSGGR